MQSSEWDAKLAWAHELLRRVLLGTPRHSAYLFFIQALLRIAYIIHEEP